jgi:hypothetical protein
MKVSRKSISTLVVLLAGILTISAPGQNLVSGDVTGIVTDPSDAVVPNNALLPFPARCIFLAISLSPFISATRS